MFWQMYIIRGHRGPHVSSRKETECDSTNSLYLFWQIYVSKVPVPDLENAFNMTARSACT
jgi:hypothetical protein